MSIRFRDKNGIERVVSGLTPGGDIEYGAVATRQGTIAIPSLAANAVTTTEITFSESMPDNNYEVTLTVSSLNGPQGGNTLFMPFSKTPNGFILAGYNGNSAVVEGTTLVWKAFKLYEVADAEQLYSKVTDIEAMVPSNASSTNKFATADDLRTDVRGLDRRLDDVEDVIPTSASITNKLVTESDLSSVEIDKVEDINDVELTNIQDGQTLIWDNTNSKWINGQGGKTYTAGDGINISNTDEISAKIDDTSITTDSNDALKVADTYKTIFVGTQAQWDALSTADKVKYDEAHITDDVIGGEVADEVTNGLMSPVTSNAVYDALSNIGTVYSANTHITTEIGAAYTPVVDLQLPAGTYIVVFQYRPFSAPSSGTVRMWYGFQLNKNGGCLIPDQAVDNNAYSSTGCNLTHIISSNSAFTISGEIFVEGGTYTPAVNDGCKLLAIRIK